jgi:acyl carrier protein
LSNEEILTNVRRIIGEMCPLGAREAGPDERIMEDLGYDSMAVVELALVLEAEFELEPIEEEQAIDLVTVRDVAELVEHMVSARA